MAHDSRAQAKQRLVMALRHVRNAQANLAQAQSELASIVGVLPRWKRVGKLYDLVHAEWYRLSRSLDSKKIDLDSLSKEEWEKDRRFGRRMDTSESCAFWAGVDDSTETAKKVPEWKQAGVNGDRSKP